MRVFDKDNIASPLSNTEVFYCYASPIFAFSNCTPNQIIQNSSFEATLSYNQSQDEPLNNYQFVLYNENHSEISRSGVLYNASQLKYFYSNLDDKQKYYFRAVGETLNRIQVDTGMLPVSVQYITPSLYALVELLNMYLEGMVRIRSNIISIAGKSNPDPPRYIDNREVDLSDAGSWIKFD